MKILYCTWGEWSAEDVCESLTALGHTVIKYEKRPEGFVADARYEQELEDFLKNDPVDIIFTMNYLPVVSTVAEAHDVRYISYVYDCPHLTLYSKTILNKCNHFFIFDKKMADSLKEAGAKNVHHHALAVNTTRISRQLASGQSNSLNKYQNSSDVTFLGTLYEDSNNHFDQIAGLPLYYHGYVDAIVASQQLIYGYDMTLDAVSDSMCDEILKYASFDLGESFFDVKRDIVRDWIRKKVTVAERRGLIKNLLDNGFSVDLFSPQRPDNLGVNYLGYANYYKEMPFIFNESKINLNITLRSILSGIPLRVIDILGAGGFCLTNYQPEIADTFEDGVELAVYGGVDELIEKTAFYLSHDEERRKIALAGMKRAQGDFSYEKRLSSIMSLI